MRGKGLFRLWIVLTIIAVPSFALYLVNDNMATWDTLNQHDVEICVNQEGSSATFNADDCIHKSGGDKTMFEHEHMTPAAYWGEAIGVSLLFDLVITAIIAALVGAILWVKRGFASNGEGGSA